MKFSERKQRVGALRRAETAADVVQVIDNTKQNVSDRIPDDVWDIMQDTGRVATQRLLELLNSTRFHRLRTSDQAKLIQLAQDRAYGRADNGVKRTIKAVITADSDATATALARMNTRAILPEFNRFQTADVSPADQPLSRVMTHDGPTDPDPA